MKRFLIALALIVLLPIMANSAPFLVCDPYPTTELQPTEFELNIDGGTLIISPAEALSGGGVSLKYDLQGVSVGAHTVSIRACLVDAVWGRECSIATPFAFTRPAAPLMKTISLSR